MKLTKGLKLFFRDLKKTKGRHFLFKPDLFVQSTEDGEIETIANLPVLIEADVEILDYKTFQGIVGHYDELVIMSDTLEFRGEEGDQFFFKKVQSATDDREQILSSLDHKRNEVGGMFLGAEIVRKTQALVRTNGAPLISIVGNEEQGVEISFKGDGYMADKVEGRYKVNHYIGNAIDVQIDAQTFLGLPNSDYDISFLDNGIIEFVSLEQFYSRRIAA